MHSLTSNQVKATKKSALKADFFVFYGAKEIRTPDPLHAMQVLYQLSYNPVCKQREKINATLSRVRSKDLAKTMAKKIKLQFQL